MARRTRLWLVPVVLLGLVLAGCGGAGPDIPGDDDDDPSTWTIAVRQLSPIPDDDWWVYTLDQTPFLDWTDVTDAVAWQLQIADDYADVNAPDTTGTTPITDCSTSSFQVTTVCDWDASSFWRVRAFKADGTASKWTMPFQFQPTQLPLYSPFPAADGMTDDTTPTLDWNDVTGAVSYDVTVASNNDRTFYEIFTVIGLTSSEYTLTGVAPQLLTPGTSYYWFVRARNEDGEYGAWSMGYKFTVQTTDVPVGNLRNGVSTLDKTPELSWNAVSGATRYEVYVGDSPAELDAAVAANVTVTNYEIPLPSAFGTHKYWRIKAYNASSILIATSVDFDFVISNEFNPIGTPNGLTSPTSPTLGWTKLLGTDNYEVEVARDPDFHDLTETAGPSTNAYTVVNAVNYGSSRYWRVRACNSEDDDKTGWSATFCFTVRWTYTITVTAPAHASTIFDQTPLLDWSDVSFSHTYEVWVSDSFPIIPSYSSKYVTSDTLSKLQLASALPMEATRYWRVRPFNLDGVVGDWSSTFSFTPSATVTLSPLPADGFADTDTTPTVSWSAVAGAASYWIQTATSAAGVAGATATSMGTNLSYTFPAVPAGSYRYWRVQAKNDSGTGSAWTPVSSVGVTWSYAQPTPNPADGAGTSGDTTPLLGWTAISGASSYQIQSATTTPIDDGAPAATCASNSYQVTTVLANGTYYWRIRPVNAEGFPGPWSHTWSFKIP